VAFLPQHSGVIPGDEVITSSLHDWPHGGKVQPDLGLNLAVAVSIDHSAEAVPIAQLLVDPKIKPRSFVVYKPYC